MQKKYMTHCTVYVEFNESRSLDQISLYRYGTLYSEMQKSSSSYYHDIQKNTMYLSYVRVMKHFLSDSIFFIRKCIEFKKKFRN